MMKKKIQDSFKGTTVDVQEGRFEKALRTFTKKVQDAGILKETRERQFYEKPSVKKKRKKQMARKRWLKKLSKMNPETFGKRK